MWKSIKGYEGLYMVSDSGEVLSCERIGSDGRKLKEKRIYGGLFSNGYPFVCLRKDGVNKSQLIHRLVAESFIPNPNNHYGVRNIDGDKLNNHVDNLEWFKKEVAGSDNPNYKHGLNRIRLHRIYNVMKSRCYNENIEVYKYYGSRGIAICQEWKDDFMNFYNWSMQNGYSDELSIDRIDVNGNYDPLNCRWVTAKEQANNTRRNVLIIINEERKTLMQWCDTFNMNYKSVRDRLHRGWSVEDALTLPVNNRFRRKKT